MPTQVLPITDLAKAGVVIDSPSVSLPPNVFSDVRNVRFRDGAIRKMEGEERIITQLGVSDLVFIDWWPESSLAPDDGYYVLVSRVRNVSDDGGIDTVHLIRAGSVINGDNTGNLLPTGWVQRWQDTDPPYWQGSLFNGGFAFVLNNTISTPRYVVNNSATPLQDLRFLELPGWDSYLVEENITTIIWDSFTIDNDLGLDLGQFVNLTGQRGNTDAENDDRISSSQLVVGEQYEIPIGVQGDWVQFGSPDNAPGTIFFATSTGTSVDREEFVWRVGDQQILMSVQSPDENISTYTVVIGSIDEVGAGISGAVQATDPVTGLAIPPIAGPAANVGYNPATGTHFIVPAARIVESSGQLGEVVRQQGVLPGDTVTIVVRTVPEINVRAGVIRSFGNLIVAGDLTETRRSQGGGVVRRLPGLVRTSDVAAPGSIPANWNPFRVGVNTADEFTLSSTGTVQDMRELQGVMYVYTNESIHAIQQTGNPTLPFAVRPVSTSYGCQTTDAVQEFDGRHVVIGSNDIFIFQGHPGSIKSIADARVRYYFFDDLAEQYQMNLFTLLNRRQDEIWICYPSVNSMDGQCDKVLIWNYRDNTWTIREQSPMWRAVTAPTYESVGNTASVNPNKIRPLCVTDGYVFMADADTYHTARLLVDMTPIGYLSYVERRRLAMTPEFNTENLLSIAMLTQAYDIPLDPVTGERLFEPNLRFNVLGTEVPNDRAVLRADDYDVAVPFITNLFDVSANYKVDIREHGRLLNYRIEDNSRPFGWDIAGLQFDIGAGGTR